jgi:hypothetical protein
MCAVHSDRTDSLLYLKQPNLRFGYIEGYVLITRHPSTPNKAGSASVLSVFRLKRRRQISFLSDFSSVGGKRLRDSNVFGDFAIFVRMAA